MSSGVWKCRGFVDKKATRKRLNDHVAVNCPGKTADIWKNSSSSICTGSTWRSLRASSHERRREPEARPASAGARCASLSYRGESYQRDHSRWPV